MKLDFAKFHGLGNDFVLIADPDDRLSLSSDQVRAICDRRFGVGGDGVIRVAPGREGGELFMDYVNSDGSIGEMCGNGIRCLAVFARDEGLSTSRELKVETRAGLKVVELLDDGRVRVDMGAPIFTPAEVPVAGDAADALHTHIDLGDVRYEAACLSMGNPHAVIVVDDPASVDVPAVGRRIEHHETFPNKTNVEFVRVDSPQRVTMRVWERGAGETLACGTGACAVGVAARLLWGAGAEVTIALPGGELEIEWHGSLDNEQPVFMTGPAVRAFDGSLTL